MIAIFNSIIAGMGALLLVFINLLPHSPFSVIPSLDSTWLKYINYFIPVTSMLAHLALFIVAVGSYYLIRVVLRWIKAIE